jgi:uncharacterized protein YjbI with pentapeptide repeats
MDENKLPQPRSRFKPVLKMLAIGVPLFIAYTQYLENNAQDRIDRAETAFTGVGAQLEADSAAVRGAGVRRLFVLAFRELPVEVNATWYAPFSNLLHMLYGSHELRMLDRCRTLLREYARSARESERGSFDLVATTIARTAKDWIKEEAQKLDTQPTDPKLWFFFRANLKKAHIPGIDLRNAIVAKEDLSEAVLTGAHFDRAYMPGIDLTNARLDNSFMKYANLGSARLDGAMFNFADLSSADLRRASLVEADLSLADLSGTQLREANLAGVSFRSAKLVGASFIGADLQGANFAGADLRLVDFTNADLRGADFRFADSLREVKAWQGSNFDGALFPPGFGTPTSDNRFDQTGGG